MIAVSGSIRRRFLENVNSFRSNYGASNVRQKPNKSDDFAFLYEMIPMHLGFYEVGSQFSLRWFFQHALAWKGHVPSEKSGLHRRIVGCREPFQRWLGRNLVNRALGSDYVLDIAHPSENLLNHSSPSGVDIRVGEATRT